MQRKANFLQGFTSSQIDGEKKAKLEVFKELQKIKDESE